MIICIIVNRAPKDENWRQKWNYALSKHDCSNGDVVCSQHFTTNDYKKKGTKFFLSRLAVPSIFISENSAHNIQCVDDNLEFNFTENVNTTNELTENIDVLKTRLANLQIEKDGIEASMTQTNELQSDQIKKLETEINLIKKKNQESDLIQFALNATDAKV